MPAETTIEWTESTWNPVTGCSKVSPGCAHCYAETLSLRFGRSKKAWLPAYAAENVVFHPKRLDQPTRWKRPRMIFVNSMSDLFHELVPLDYIRQVFDVMAANERHVFQVLTKRHERLAELAPELEWPGNVWMGVSIENSRWAERADRLRTVPAAVRFISAEPLLGPLNALDLTGIHWVIAGGESGPGHRAMNPEWVRALRDQCQHEGVAFFFKQWGGIRPQSNGRLLDDLEWNEMPETAYVGGNEHQRNGARARVARPRDIPDDADEKWYLTEHSKAKHEILRRYLGAWLSILGQGRGGRRWDELILVDAFAGRGIYMEGEPGSPQIMFERAVEVVETGRAKKVLIRCAEPNAGNLSYLKDVCEGLTHENVRIKATQETFVEIGTHLAEWAEGQAHPRPIFVMVDPFGVSGVPFDLLERLLKIDRLEVLLTFMVRDPSRFLEEENYEEPMTALFGGDAWRKCIEATDRPECLMLRFQEVVCERGIAKHALPFRVYEDARKIVLYYLVHLTNSNLGMREMKDEMVKKSGDMTFWPVTVKDPNQLELEVSEEKPYPTLQKLLLEKYGGREMTFEELLNQDYPSGDAWTEPYYRAAAKGLAEGDDPKVVIERKEPLTSTGKPSTALKLPDKIKFAGPT
jgi:three-Cys-motif partner protein